MTELTTLENNAIATVAENNGVRAIVYDKEGIEKFLQEKQELYNNLTVEPENALSLKTERADWNKFYDKLKRTRIDTQKEYLKPYENVLKTFESDFKEYEKTANNIISCLDNIIKTGEELRRDNRRKLIIEHIDRLEMPLGVDTKDILITDSMLVHSNNNWAAEIREQVEALERAYQDKVSLELARQKQEAQEADNYKQISIRVSEVNKQYGINLDERKYYVCRTGLLSDAYALIEHDRLKAINAKLKEDAPKEEKQPEVEQVFKYQIVVKATPEVLGDSINYLKSHCSFVSLNGIEIK